MELQLDRVSSIASKYIGRPISRLSPIQPIPFSPLDLTMGCFRGQAIGPSLDLDLLSRNSSIATLPMQRVGIADMEKSIMMETAANAMNELMRLAQSNDPLWMRSSVGNELLNLEVYNKIFPRPNHPKSPDMSIEASRGSCPVVMNGLTLVNMFLDTVSLIIVSPPILCISSYSHVCLTEFEFEEFSYREVFSFLIQGYVMHPLLLIMFACHACFGVPYYRYYGPS